MTVIADWLDVTYSPENTPEQAVTDVLQSAGAMHLHSDNRGSTWRVGVGVCKIQYSGHFHRFSASGAVLGHLRASGVYMDYLSALSESPHQVTRLDAAHDVATDAAPIIAKLRKRYPRECHLTRKGLRTKSILATREDGKESGTWYVGHMSRARVTARVYDKQLEALDKRDERIPPRTRYEVTIKSDIGPSLRDAAEPESIFWHFASPALLKRPENVKRWVSGWGGGWNYVREQPVLAALVKSRIEASADLQSILALADRADCLDWCKQILLRTIDGFERQHAPEASPAFEPTPDMVAYASKIA